MDKETLSNYGWIVICVLVLAVMIALASPFGSYVASAVENTTKGLFDVEQGALNAAGITIADQSFEGGSESASPSPEELIAQGIVPEGGVYIAGLTYDDGGLMSSVWTGGTTYTAGQKMPSAVTSNDLFIYGNYAYMYNRSNLFNNGEGCPYQYNGNGYTIVGFSTENTSMNGWQVGLIEANKTSYGTILSNINGKPVTSLERTFSGCTSLETAPAIPSSVMNMNSTFYGCTALTTAPDMSYATSVTSMNYTFAQCSSLETAPVIPRGVTSMDSTFQNCTSLTTAPTIPNCVTNMSCAFLNCTALTEKISIPCTLENKNYTYGQCTATIEYYHFEGCGH